MIMIGRCACCDARARLENLVCAGCVHSYGERIALLISKARRDSTFASQCLARMTPRARAAFAHACGVRAQTVQSKRALFLQSC